MKSTYTLAQRTALLLVPPLAAAIIRILGSTLRYTDITDSDARPGDQLPGPAIYAFWHRSLLICAHRFRNRNIAILISPSFDGELIARTVKYLGFHPVRGSSSRSGSAGLRALARAYQAGSLCAITADGPRGPGFIAKPGPVQLASIVAAPQVSAFYALPLRAWTLQSWDRFLIPKPFSTVRITWPAAVPPDLPSLQLALDRSVTMAESPPSPKTPPLS